MDMKKILLIAGAAAALILTGCNQGGTSDQYGTSNGNANSSNSVNNAHTASSNAPVTP
jgi:protein involved in sex pheromone biosynthesis